MEPPVILSLESAATIVDRALNEGRARGLRPLCVAVLDAGGHLLVLKRDTDASALRPQIAMAKAAACIAMGFGGRELARRAKAAPEFFQLLNHMGHGALAPVVGGVLVKDAGGRILGAAGASGETSENDEACLLAGVLAAGLVADAG